MQDGIKMNDCEKKIRKGGEIMDKRIMFVGIVR